jgi:serine/threonine protein kinase
MEIYGTGSTGCVVPVKNCTGERKNDNDKYVSKIFQPPTKLEVGKEFDFGKQLKDIDPDNNFFIAGEEMCELQIQDISNKNTCLPNYNPNLSIVNLIMKMGKPINKIIDEWTDQQKFYKIIKTFAHLVVAVKMLISDSNIITMDIKNDNILFNTKTKGQNIYLFPVIIDFSAAHVILQNISAFQDYLTKFNHIGKKNFKYAPWGPEIRATRMKSTFYYTTEEIVEKLTEQQLDYLDMNNVYNYYHYYSTGTLINDLKNTLHLVDTQLMQKTTQTKRIPSDIGEKIMLFALANTFINILHKKMKLLPPYVEPFFKILRNAQHLNLETRYNCTECLAAIDEILPTASHDGKEKYMIIM